MRVRTETQLLDLLDHEFSWRLKEISDLKTSAGLVAGTSQRGVLRAGIAILYAHWEGFVKVSSEYYLSYVANQNFAYNQLKTCFIAIGLRREIQFGLENETEESRRQAIDFIQNSLAQPAKLPVKGTIRTKSNLNSEVFEAIARSIGIDPHRYETKYTLIDEGLLARRNSIAHGVFLSVDSESYTLLSDEVVSLIRGFKTDLENAIALKAYFL